MGFFGDFRLYGYVFKIFLGEPMGGPGAWASRTHGPQGPGPQGPGAQGHGPQGLGPPWGAPYKSHIRFFRKS